MTLIFLSLAVIIAIVVILVSAKFIKAGFDARGEVKEQQRNENRKPNINISIAQRDIKNNTRNIE